MGIAATGFALGRQEQRTVSRPTSKKRRVDDAHLTQSSPVVGSTPVHARPVSASLPQSSPGPQVTPFRQADGGFGQRLGEGTLFESSMEDIQTPPAAQPRSTTLDSSVGGLEGDLPHAEVRPSYSGRPSSSWLHRMSTISSLNDSPLSSSRPGTPSISFSNHSNTPMLPATTGNGSTIPPNKLVKRTLSHRALSSNYAQQSTSARPTFRRPATSHQRSATLRQLALDENQELSLPNQSVDLPPSHSEPSSSAQIWRPYFGSGYPRSSGGQNRKRYSSGFTKRDSIKTVTPSSGDHPTLLMGTSVIPRISEDELDMQNDRPLTRGSLHSTDMKDASKFSSNVTRTSTEVADASRKGRLSFSFGDNLFSSSPASWKVSRTESLRKKKPAANNPHDRAVSSPLPPATISSTRDKITSRLQRQRNVTDPAFFRPPKARPQLDLTVTKNYRSVNHSTELSSPLPPLSHLSAFDIELPYGSPTYGTSTFPPPLSRENTSSPNTTSLLPSQKVRQQRQSLAHSDPSSILMSSDGDTRVFTSGDEDSMEFQSDTAYDSLATRATASSNSGIRGDPIETVFDRPATGDAIREKLLPLETLIQGGSFSEAMSNRSSKSSMIDAYEDVSTPVRPSVIEGLDQMATPIQGNTRTSFDLPSSPPSMAETQINVGHGLNAAGDKESQDWLEENEAWDDLSGVREQNKPDMPSPQLPKHFAVESPLHSVRVMSVNQLGNNDPSTEKSKRLSIFELSESQKTDKDVSYAAKQRPKTVHGKNGPEGRGSRPPGRRGPSALHLRSQSVPVNKEPTHEKDLPQQPSKYGTWGLGNKGASEEWSDDFEFDEIDDSKMQISGVLPNSSGSAPGLEVPQSIIDRQASVHGQFGQIQELTLLVEELKRMRHAAGNMGIITGQSKTLWEEAEGIINLATIDEDKDDVLPPRSPSSPGFGHDPFEDDPLPIAHDRKQQPLDNPTRHRTSVSRRSISSPATPPVTRPRGESTAQAKTVLQTLYQSRGFVEKEREKSPEEPRKLPFDTQDLRDLVVRAGVVTRALKEIVRKAEGISQSPDRPSRIGIENDDDDSPLRKIFQPPHASPKKGGIPKSKSANSYLGSPHSSNSDADITSHMQMMTVV